MLRQQVTVKYEEKPKVPKKKPDLTDEYILEKLEKYLLSEKHT